MDTEAHTSELKSVTTSKDEEKVSIRNQFERNADDFSCDKLIEPNNESIEEAKISAPTCIRIPDEDTCIELPSLDKSNGSETCPPVIEKSEAEEKYQSVENMENSETGTKKNEALQDKSEEMGRSQYIEMTQNVDITSLKQGHGAEVCSGTDIEPTEGHISTDQEISVESKDIVDYVPETVSDVMTDGGMGMSQSCIQNVKKDNISSTSTRHFNEEYEESSSVNVEKAERSFDSRDDERSPEMTRSGEVVDNKSIGNGEASIPTVQETSETHENQDNPKVAAEIQNSTEGRLPSPSHEIDIRALKEASGHEIYENIAYSNVSDEGKQYEEETSGGSVTAVEKLNEAGISAGLTREDDRAALKDVSTATDDREIQFLENTMCTEVSLPQKMELSEENLGILVHTESKETETAASGENNDVSVIVKKSKQDIEEDREQNWKENEETSISDDQNFVHVKQPLEVHTTEKTDMEIQCHDRNTISMGTHGPLIADEGDEKLKEITHEMFESTEDKMPDNSNTEGTSEETIPSEIPGMVCIIDKTFEQRFQERGRKEDGEILIDEEKCCSHENDFRTDDMKAEKVTKEGRIEEEVEEKIEGWVMETKETSHTVEITRKTLAEDSEESLTQGYEHINEKGNLFEENHDETTSVNKSEANDELPKTAEKDQSNQLLKNDERREQHLEEMHELISDITNSNAITEHAEYITGVEGEETILNHQETVGVHMKEENVTDRKERTENRTTEQEVCAGPKTDITSLNAQNQEHDETTDVKLTKPLVTEEEEELLKRENEEEATLTCIESNEEVEAEDILEQKVTDSFDHVALKEEETETEYQGQDSDSDFSKGSLATAENDLSDRVNIEKQIDGKSKIEEHENQSEANQTDLAFTSHATTAEFTREAKSSQSKDNLNTNNFVLEEESEAKIETSPFAYSESKEESEAASFSNDCQKTNDSEQQVQVSDTSLDRADKEERKPESHNLVKGNDKIPDKDEVGETVQINNEDGEATSADRQGTGKTSCVIYAPDHELRDSLFSLDKQDPITAIRSTQVETPTSKEILHTDEETRYFTLNENDVLQEQEFIRDTDVSDLQKTDSTEGDTKEDMENREGKSSLMAVVEKNDENVDDVEGSKMRIDEREADNKSYTVDNEESDYGCHMVIIGQKAPASNMDEVSTGAHAPVDEATIESVDAGLTSRLEDTSIQNDEAVTPKNAEHADATKEFEVAGESMTKAQTDENQPRDNLNSISDKDEIIESVEEDGEKVQGETERFRDLQLNLEHPIEVHEGEKPRTGEELEEQIVKKESGTKETHMISDGTDKEIEFVKEFEAKNFSEIERSKDLEELITSVENFSNLASIKVLQEGAKTEERKRTLYESFNLEKNVDDGNIKAETFEGKLGREETSLNETKKENEQVNSVDPQEEEETRIQTEDVRSEIVEYEERKEKSSNSMEEKEIYKTYGEGREEVDGVTGDKGTADMVTMTIEDQATSLDSTDFNEIHEREFRRNESKDCGSERLKEEIVRSESNFTDIHVAPATDETAKETKETVPDSKEDIEATNSSHQTTHLSSDVGHNQSKDKKNSMTEVVGERNEDDLRIIDNSAAGSETTIEEKHEMMTQDKGNDCLVMSETESSLEKDQLNCSPLDTTSLTQETHEVVISESSNEATGSKSFHIEKDSTNASQPPDNQRYAVTASLLVEDADALDLQGTKTPSLIAKTAEYSTIEKTNRSESKDSEQNVEGLYADNIKDIHEAPTATLNARSANIEAMCEDKTTTDQSLSHDTFTNSCSKQLVHETTTVPEKTEEHKGETVILIDNGSMDNMAATNISEESELQKEKSRDLKLFELRIPDEYRGTEEDNLVEICTKVKNTDSNFSLKPHGVAEKGSIPEARNPTGNSLNFKTSDLLEGHINEVLTSEDVNEENRVQRETDAEETTLTEETEAETKTIKLFDQVEDVDDGQGKTKRNSKSDTDQEATVTDEAFRDSEVKVAYKKSHNILSGVGSKVKHSISKVKKALVGKSSPSHQKSTSN